MESRTSLEIHMVTAADSPEFSLLQSALRRSSVVGLDAEWKPSRAHPSSCSSAVPAPAPSFPTVTLLQIACRVRRERSGPAVGDSPVFLVDLLSVPLSCVWEPLRDMFVSPQVLKLGFRFKQDLIYLSSTFSSHGCHPGFDRVEPFVDIASIYHQLKYLKVGKKFPKETKSLAAICEEMLGIFLSKVSSDFDLTLWGYLSFAFKEELTQCGIIHQFSCPHFLSQNCKHCHIIETARSLLLSASMLSLFQGEAAPIAVYLINQIPTTLIACKSPYKCLYNAAPDYNVRHVFGYVCYVLLPAVERTKMSPRS